MSGTSGRTDRSVQLAGIPNAMRALFNTKALRDEVIERYGADERGRKTHWRHTSNRVGGGNAWAK